MYWSILAIAVIAFFVWHGFATRCPMCGVRGHHPKDEGARGGQAKTAEFYRSIGFKSDPELARYHVGAKPGFATAPFRCRRCDHPFQRNHAAEWERVASKLGAEVALSEYQKLREQ